MTGYGQWLTVLALFWALPVFWPLGGGEPPAELKLCQTFCVALSYIGPDWTHLMSAPHSPAANFSHSRAWDVQDHLLSQMYATTKTWISALQHGLLHQ